MNISLSHGWTRCARITINLTLIITLLCNFHVPNADAISLPTIGTRITLSTPFTPVIMNGMTLHPNNPFQIDFIIDEGDDPLSGEAFQKESQRLIHYFMATLTVPHDEMWVNLSPYEQDRIIADGLSQTEMGRDMLIQDYMLKQLTASLMYPEEELGKTFWKKVYAKAQAQYGTTDIPTDTFHKVWIVPASASVYVHDNNVFINNAHLKVMLEHDYFAMRHHNHKAPDTKHLNTTSDDLSSEIIREVILPAIEKEVNEGQTFANLRQIYQAMILATWYKNNLNSSLLNHAYADKNTLAGIDHVNAKTKEKVYAQYVASFKQGVYDYIKEEHQPETMATVTRHYFSGGLEGADRVDTHQGQPSAALIAKRQRPQQYVHTDFLNDSTHDRAMLAELFAEQKELERKITTWFEQNVSDEHTAILEDINDVNTHMWQAIINTQAPTNETDVTNISTTSTLTDQDVENTLNKIIQDIYPETVEIMLSFQLEATINSFPDLFDTSSKEDLMNILKNSSTVSFYGLMTINALILFNIYSKNSAIHKMLNPTYTLEGIQSLIPEERQKAEEIIKIDPESTEAKLLIQYFDFIEKVINTQIKATSYQEGSTIDANTIKSDDIISIDDPLPQDILDRMTNDIFSNSKEFFNEVKTPDTLEILHDKVYQKGNILIIPAMDRGLEEEDTQIFMFYFTLNATKTHVEYLGGSAFQGSFEGIGFTADGFQSVFNRNFSTDLVRNMKTLSLKKTNHNYQAIIDGHTIIELVLSSDDPIDADVLNAFEQSLILDNDTEVQGERFFPAVFETSIDDDDKTDKSMTTTQKHGGINLDAALLNLSSEGDVIHFNVDQAMIQQFQQHPLDVIRPRIIHIAPITNFPMLLGLKEDNENETTLAKS